MHAARSIRPHAAARMLHAAEALDPQGGPAQGLSRLAAADPLRAPGFLAAWYAAYGDPARDPVVLATGERRLLGALALTRAPEGPGGLVRGLRSTTNSQSPYAALLLDPAAPPEVLPALLDAAFDASRADVLRLRKLPEALLPALTKAAGALGAATVLERPFESAVLRFGPDRAASLPPRAAKTLKRERALAAEGRLAFEAVEDAADLPAALEAYLAAEGRSWKREAGVTLDANPATPGFYRALIASPDPDLRVAIHFLTLDGAPIAGRICLARGRRLVPIKIFHDEAFARFAPGVLLRHRSLEHIAAASAIAEIDYANGSDHVRPYANAVERYADLSIWRRGLRALAARSAESIDRRLHRGRAAPR